MPELTVLQTIFFLIWFCNFLLVPALSVGSFYLRFWSRERIDTHPIYKLQKFKYGWAHSTWYMPHHGTQYKDQQIFFWVIIDGGLLAMTCLIMYLLTSTLGFYFPIGLVSLVVIMLLPRLLMDLVHTLDYNHETGDSERLSDLEDEIAELKDKVK
jgi:hypothetical protein